MRSLVLVIALMTTLIAHDLDNRVEQKVAVVMTLTYPDGEPFSYEPYTLYAPISDTIPFQEGVTAKNGTVSFVPDTTGTWTLKAASEDGHGAVITYEATLDFKTTNQTVSMPYWQRLMMGVSLIFGLFGLVTLFRSKKGDI